MKQLLTELVNLVRYGDQLQWPWVVFCTPVSGE